MPTGYTSIIPEGATLRQYVLRCARAMGALMHMRDEPMDAPLPVEVLPSLYYQQALKRGRERYERLLALTPEQKKEEYERARAEQARESLEAEAKAEVERRAYAKMRAQVLAWLPPTPEHVGLKRFMLEQIDMSVVPLLPLQSEERPAVPSVEEWYEAKVARALDHLQYQNDQWVQVQRRCRAATTWIRELVQSLPTDDVGREPERQS